MTKNNIHDLFNVDADVLRDVMDSNISYKLKGFYKDESFMSIFVHALYCGSRIDSILWNETTICDALAYVILEKLSINPDKFNSYLIENDFDEIYKSIPGLKLDVNDKIKYIQMVAEQYLQLNMDEFNYRKSAKELYRLLGIRNEPRLQNEDGSVKPIPKYLCIEENRALFIKILKKITKPFLGDRAKLLKYYTPAFLKRNGLGNPLKYLFENHFVLLNITYPNQFKPWDVKMLSLKDKNLPNSALQTLLEFEIWVRTDLTKLEFNKMISKEVDETSKEKPLTKFLKSRRLFYMFESDDIIPIAKSLRWSDKKLYKQYKDVREFLLAEDKKGKLPFGFSMEGGLAKSVNYTWLVKFQPIAEGYYIDFLNFNQLNTVVATLEEVNIMAKNKLQSYVSISKDDDTEEYNDKDIEQYRNKVAVLEKFNLSNIKLDKGWFTTLVDISIDKSML